VSKELLPAVVIEPEEPATASVIWLHGLGADGYDFEPIVPQLGLGVAPVRFIFPHAPHRPVTVNNGYVMRAWYDITSPDLSEIEDEAGTRESEQQLCNWIEHERELGIAVSRIVVAGFSQGGAIVLHTGLRFPERLAGIMALSTYLPLADSVEKERHAANSDVPLFMAHGLQDTIIPLPLAEKSRARIEALGNPLEWHSYPMPHSVCHEEIMDIAAWLKKVLVL
jgi:phospholipase/carboxylesterase